MNRLSNESDWDYKKRLIIGRKEDVYDLTWKEIQALINDHTHTDNFARMANGIYEYYQNESKISTETKNKFDNDITNKEIREIKSDGSITSDKITSINDINNPKSILEAHGFDSDYWELISAKNSNWNSGDKTLYSSKINVRPIAKGISISEIDKHFKEFSRRYSPTLPNYNYDINNSNKILTVELFDVHYAKLSWKPETGESYNHKIAEERVMFVVNDVLNKTKNFEFEKIYFSVGNDFFNYDDTIGNTTAGTRQVSDSRWQKMFNNGVELLIRVIDTLSAKAPVEVFCVSGNHDLSTSYYATKYLSAWYRNSKIVNVDTSPFIRKYVEYGKNLIGYTHGNKEGKRINGIMQVEMPEAWGRTKYREWHRGHLHSEHCIEENGVIIRNISSITSSDDWHVESGYVGAIKKAQSFIYDKEKGLECTINSIIT